MKKIKNILLMSILSICSFAFVSVANAETFDLQETNLYCTPESISAGSTARCYLIGKPSIAEATHTLSGFVVETYATKDLTITGVERNNQINNSKAVYTKFGSSTSKPFSNIEVLKDFTCSFNAVADATDSGCSIFYSGDKLSDPNVYSGITIKNNVASFNLPTSYATYGVVGAITVEVSDTATGEKCGELCVSVWKISNSKDYASYKDCATGTSIKDGYTCGGTTTNQTNGKFKCKEIHLKAKGTPTVDPDSPATGAFASYAILAAGALIAISAVAMAKKNTKFNKI